MGKEKTTTIQEPESTPEMTEMNKLLLEQFQQTVGPQTQLQLQGMDLLSQIFSGAENLPGIFGEMGAGISPETIGTQAASLAKQYGPGFQNLGIADSGVAFQQTAQGIANELLFPAEQINLAAQQNLLNLALGGQAQVQQPMMAGQGMLGQQLAGLTSMTQTQYGMNPFIKSYQQSMGAWLGGGAQKTAMTVAGGLV